MAKYKSDVFAAIHENLTDLHEIGLIDKKTMHDFDQRCLTPVKPLTPAEIKAIREKEHFSQSVFANYLNINKNLLSEWERGVKKPSGAALKLLTLVQHKGVEAIA
ncbi:DNA-binding transcriptional regulator [Pasteurellaceae bacterium LIM206]|nr:DNA-binding transcriptional regulator [Pasteurellaceae bacterium LIM206]